MIEILLLALAPCLLVAGIGLIALALGAESIDDEE